jgi:hypothetical protein
MKTYILCPDCAGTGIQQLPLGPVPCPKCQATGGNAEGFISKPIPPLYYAYDIYNCLNEPECGSLPAEVVPWLNILISQGIIDMADGHLAKTVLWEWFGSGSVTRANLIALLGA